MLAVHEALKRVTWPEDADRLTIEAAFRSRREDLMAERHVIDCAELILFANPGEGLPDPHGFADEVEAMVDRDLLAAVLPNRIRALPGKAR